MTKIANPIYEDVRYNKIELFNTDEIKLEAKRCLGCKNHPCSLACPIQNEPHHFIDLIKKDKEEEGAKFVYDKNAFSSICGMICPSSKYCEASCLRGKIDKPIEIRKLHLYLANLNDRKDRKNKPELKPLVGKNVAIIGGGPVGVYIAHKLSIDGVNAEIFESLPYLGGALKEQIPTFRLDKNTIKKDFDYLLNNRIKVHLNMSFGKDIKFNELKAKYDAIVFAIGMHEARIYDFMKGHPKVILAQDFLRKMRHDEIVDAYERIVVIGGSDVAMDCIASAKYVAKEVYGVYRREKERLRANEEEKRLAFQVVDKYIFNRTPLRFDEFNNMVFKDYYGDEEDTIPADLYILAIGTMNDEKALENIFDFKDNNIVSKCDDKVFYAGDMDAKDKTLVSALQSANVCLKNLYHFLRIDD